MQRKLAAPHPPISPVGDDNGMRSSLHVRAVAVEEASKPRRLPFKEDSCDSSCSSEDKRRRCKFCPDACSPGTRGRGRPGCCIGIVPPLILFFSSTALCGVRDGYFHQSLDHFDDGNVMTGKLEFTFGWAAACAIATNASSSSASFEVTGLTGCSYYTSFFNAVDPHPAWLAAGGFGTGILHMLSAAMALALTVLNCAGFWDPLLRAPCLNLLLAVVGLAMGVLLLAMSSLFFPLAAMELLELGGSARYLNGDYGYTMGMLNALLWLSTGLIALYGKVTQSENVEDDMLLAEQEAKWEQDEARVEAVVNGVVDALRAAELGNEGRAANGGGDDGGKFALGGSGDGLSGDLSCGVYGSRRSAGDGSDGDGHGGAAAQAGAARWDAVDEKMGKALAPSPTATGYAAHVSE